MTVEFSPSDQYNSLEEPARYKSSEHGAAIIARKAEQEPVRVFIFNPHDGSESSFVGDDFDFLRLTSVIRQRLSVVDDERSFVCRTRKTFGKRRQHE